MEGFATIQGSGARGSPAITSQQPPGSSPSNAGQDVWHTMDATESGRQQPTAGPRLIFESEAGHRIVLSYEDLVLAALLVGLAIEASGWLK